MPFATLRRVLARTNERTNAKLKRKSNLIEYNANHSLELERELKLELERKRKL